ncbi:MAG: phosphotransferase enzyme family protein [Promethearchaeota archaeon]
MSLIPLEIPEIFDQFAVPERFQEAISYGSGHINKSYKILTKGERKHRDRKHGNRSTNYLLQKINHRVFENPHQLQANIHAITSHLTKKIVNSLANPNRQTVLSVIPTKSGENLVCWDKHYDNLKDPGYWRLYEFIDDSRYFDIPQNRKQVHQAGIIFGKFERDVEDFPLASLHETIPKFHNLAHKYTLFQNSLVVNFQNRRKNCLSEIQFVQKHLDAMLSINRAADEGRIPYRVTHNDTKFNNVLFDQNDNAICIVDMDTIMPGLTLFDYGDALRSLTNTAPEDTTNLDEVNLDLTRLEVFSQGFLSQTCSLLNSTEQSLLPQAGATMSFMLGLRFFTDYLNGDNYFAISRPQQNLDRARVQFKMMKNFQESEGLIREIQSVFF